MRRETDFVLEQAAWPAMVLEETGAIRRVNRAALHVFGPLVEPPAANLSRLLEAPDLGNFINKAQGNACPAKLRLGNDAQADFVAHISRVTRDGHSYLVLQLFKQSGSAFPELLLAREPFQPKEPPPQHAQEQPKPSIPVLQVPKTALEPARTEQRPPDEAGALGPGIKPEPPFLLEDSPWPVLIVEEGGLILKANRSAVHEFGSNIEKTGAQLATIWLPENRQPAHEYLREVHETPRPVHLRLKIGVSCVFYAHSCQCGDNVLIQFLRSIGEALHPGILPAAPPHPAPSPVAAKPLAPIASAAPAAVAAAGQTESSFLHKQKLDCAMQLARSVALDFNNALTSILGHTSLLLGRADANHPFRESLVEIEKSATKAAEIANDLAAFTRQEKDTRQQTSGNVNTLLERAMETFRAEHSAVTWSLQFERRLCTANFDEPKMQQAFVKIIENSIQACKAAARISLQTQNLELTEATQDLNARLNPGNYVCVEISDNGEGIAPDVLPRIFEPFFTTKGRNHRGLGLAWVYGIVTNHGGAVAVSSKVGAGTSVRIYLPANKKLVRSINLSNDDLRGTETILFVDDEDLMLTMGQMVLSSYGYTVLAANSGQKALEIAAKAKKPIDLMVTDLVMPGMGGAELTEKFQKISPHSRIIWASGAVRNSKDQNVDSYLPKPFTAQDLLRKIKEALTG